MSFLRGNICRPHRLGIANRAERAVLFHDTRNRFKRLQGRVIKRALPVNDIDEPTRDTNRTVQIYITIYSGKHHTGYEDKSFQFMNMDGSIVVGMFVVAGFGCCCCCCKIAAGVNPVMEGVAFTPLC